MGNGIPRISALRRALYYPYPAIQRENWLKQQALFWDALYRLIPVGFDEKRSLIDEEDRRVSQATRTEEVFRRDFDFVQDYEITGTDAIVSRAADQLSELFDVTTEWLVQNRSDKRYFSWGDLERPGKFALHGETPTLPVSTADVFRFRDVPGRLFMAFLAREVSEQHELPVVTDDPVHDAALRSGPISRMDSRSGTDHALEPRLLTLLFQFPILARASELSAERITRIRSDYDVERRTFVDELGTAGQSLASLSGAYTEDDLADLLEELARNLEKRRRQYGLALRSSKIDTALRVGALTVPVAASLSVTGLTAAGIASTLGTAALLLGMGRSAREMRASLPVAAYLFEIGRERDVLQTARRVFHLGRIARGAVPSRDALTRDQNDP